MNDTKADAKFAFKSLLKVSPFLMIGTLTGMATIAFTFPVRVFERYDMSLFPEEY